MGRRTLAEFVGTGFLLLAIVGSGIHAERLAPGHVGLQLLINAIGTAGALVALILALGPRSGAHLNPVVSLADAYFGGLGGRALVSYLTAQFGGAMAGVVLANGMFGEPVVAIPATLRSGAGTWLGEGLATFGLLLVIFGVVRAGRPSVAAFAVGAYIGAAMFFTSSTSFANPAVTVARMFTDTFTGIAPSSVPGFLIAELAGLALAVAAVKSLYPRIEEFASAVVVPHDEPGAER